VVGVCIDLSSKYHESGECSQACQSSLTLDDFLPPEWRVPRLEFVPHPDGSVTLKMKEGYDEWGNLIPEPEPEPEPELETETETETTDEP